MADDKNKQDERDRSKVSTSDDYEINYIVKKLGVTVEQVREAIANVGNHRDRIEGFLANKK
ncbi:MAG TPA: DUF3606 domain-containing protein [Dyadobacter sp.]|jgi:rRNA maturation endonuclease Nob1|nr:DUF3606 domain-containing protein [Dyadobacter sp.]